MVLGIGCLQRHKNKNNLNEVKKKNKVLFSTQNIIILIIHKTHNFIISAAFFKSSWNFEKYFLSKQIRNWQCMTCGKNSCLHILHFVCFFARRKRKDLKNVLELIVYLKDICNFLICIIMYSRLRGKGVLHKSII